MATTKVSTKLLETVGVAEGGTGATSTSAARTSLGIVAGASDTEKANIMLNAFRITVNGGLTVQNMVDGVVDEFEDATGVDASTSTYESRDSSGKYYTSTATTVADTLFTYTGSSQNHTVPSGVTSLVCKAWGAGGGTGQSDGSVAGGAGGFATGTIAVTAGNVLKIVVGGAGTPADQAAEGGGGGGMSGIFYPTALASSSSLLIAGGGGGGGRAPYSGRSAGAGGGSSGQDNANDVGTGGTQSAGGIGVSPQGNAGSSMQGGYSGNNSQAGGYGGGGNGSTGGSGGGGGGGGYYGGGGGTSTIGGGGGSGYYDSSNVTDATLTTGDRDVPGNGFVVIKGYVTAYHNMTLFSNATTALAAPDDANIVIWQEDGSSAITLNTDLKAYASRNGGTTYTQMTLSEVANLTTGRILTGTVDISGQSSATAMKYKIETLNTKDQKIHAVALQWS